MPARAVGARQRPAETPADAAERHPARDGPASSPRVALRADSAALRLPERRTTREARPSPTPAPPLGDAALPAPARPAEPQAPRGAAAPAPRAKPTVGTKRAAVSASFEPERAPAVATAPAARAASAADPSPAPGPPVEVHIGTIEVRAAPLAPPTQPAVVPAPPASALEGFGAYAGIRCYAQGVRS